MVGSFAIGVPIRVSASGIDQAYFVLGFDEEDIGTLGDAVSVVRSDLFLPKRFGNQTEHGTAIRGEGVGDEGGDFHIRDRSSAVSAVKLQIEIKIYDGDRRYSSFYDGDRRTTSSSLKLRLSSVEDRNGQTSNTSSYCHRLWGDRWAYFSRVGHCGSA